MVMSVPCGDQGSPQCTALHLESLLQLKDLDGGQEALLVLVIQMVLKLMEPWMEGNRMSQHFRDDCRSGTPA